LVSLSLTDEGILLMRGFSVLLLLYTGISKESLYMLSKAILNVDPP
jgi:hypothetical protein